jgi:hypothetical protein
MAGSQGMLGQELARGPAGAKNSDLHSVSPFLLSKLPSFARPEETFCSVLIILRLSAVLCKTETMQAFEFIDSSGNSHGKHRVFSANVESPL